jgi:hypothetical protein
MARKGNPNPRPPSSSGIPSNESLCLPSHYGRDVKAKGGLDKTVFWTVSDVLDFVFPSKYQPTYHKVSCKLVELIMTKGYAGKKDITKFMKENEISKSTLENKVIPKLVRFGLLKREREFKAGLGKGRGLVLSESLTFTAYLDRVGFAWNMLVSTARKKNKDESGEDRQLTL